MMGPYGEMPATPAMVVPGAGWSEVAPCPAGSKPALPTIKIERLLSRYWRVSTDTHYANVKQDRDGWAVDIRNNDGELLQWAGVWSTKRDAVESAQRVLESMA